MMQDDEVALVKARFDPEARLTAFRDRLALAADPVGAMASFCGIVRGGATDRLTLECYDPLTLRVMKAFAARVRLRFELTGVLLVHRVGPMTPGEPVILVAAAAAHRRAAFDGVDMLMDLMKAEAPFWKQEHRGEDARWIEPRPDDYAALARWKDNL